MKTLLISFCVNAAFFIQGMAQNPAAQSSQLYKHYQMKYIFGMKYNDGDVAKDALISMIALDPSDDSLRLQLCYYYFDNGQYPSSLFVSADMLGRNPDNLAALRFNALSYQQMGVRDRAITSYETLYLKSSNLDALFQASVLQYEAGRYSEAKTNADIIAKNPKARELTMEFSADGGDITVNMEAAAHNLKGMIEKAGGNLQEARKSFEQSLAAQPDFSLARKNLEELQ